MLRSLGPSGFAAPPYGPTFVLRPSAPINPRSMTTATVKTVSSPASRAVVKVSVALYAHPAQFLRKREGETTETETDREITQLVRGAIPVFCIWLESRDFDVVVIHTRGGIGDRVSSGDVGERVGGLTVPHLRGIKLGVGAPADGHTGRTGKGEMLLKRFVGVARNSTRNMHSCGLCET